MVAVVTCRMHDLGEFMKGLLQRCTQWFNRTHSRTGRVWEDRFKSVIVESGIAARTMAAYIDLNPVTKMLHCRIRYFTDGAAIGSREFVNEAFASARDRFGGFLHGRYRLKCGSCVMAL